MAPSRDTIVTLGNQLAPATATYGRLRTLLQDPATVMEEIINLVRLDPALTFHGDPPQQQCPLRSAHA